MSTLSDGSPLRMLYRQTFDAISRTGGTAPMSVQPYSGEPQSPLLAPIVMPKPVSLLPIYAAIILGSLLIGGVLVVIITVLRPPPADNSTLISTALTGLGVATMQALNFIKSSQAVALAVQTTSQVETLHKSVNSGFEEFARLIRAEAHAEGVKESEAKQADLVAVEARIASAVRLAVAETLAALPALPVPLTPAEVAVPIIDATLKAMPGAEGHPIPVHETPLPSDAAPDPSKGPSSGLS